MKLLLDHCVPRRFATLLLEQEARTATQQGWDALRNGEPLAAAGAAGFDALVTVDRNLGYQQNRTLLPLSIVVLIAASNRFDDLSPLAEPLRAALATLPSGSYREIAAT